MMHNTELTLSGTFMYKDTPLAEFVIDADHPTAFAQLCNDTRYFHPIMQSNVCGYTLIETLKDRATATSRQGITEAMQTLGVSGYDISALLKHNNALCVHDNYWVRFTDGPQTWDDVRRKAGFRVEHIRRF